MKMLSDSDRFQELAQFGFQTMGRVALVGLIVILISAWALTEPFYGLSKRVTRNGKVKTNKNQKGRL
jgi:hypothetical protein